MPVKSEFQKNKKYFSGHTYTKSYSLLNYTYLYKKLFIVKFKFKFNWTFCILSSNPVLE